MTDTNRASSSYHHIPNLTLTEFHFQFEGYSSSRYVSGYWKILANLGQSYYAPAKLYYEFHLLRGSFLYSAKFCNAIQPCNARTYTDCFLKNGCRRGLSNKEIKDSGDDFKLHFGLGNSSLLFDDSYPQNCRTYICIFFLIYLIINSSNPFRMWSTLSYFGA